MYDDFKQIIANFDDRQMELITAIAVQGIAPSLFRKEEKGQIFQQRLQRGGLSEPAGQYPYQAVAQ
jgi:hypothetical protein